MQRYLTQKISFCSFRSIISFIILSFLANFSPSLGIISAKTPAAPVLNLPAPGTMILPSENRAPLMLKGLVVSLEKPFQLDFIIDTGHAELNETELKEEAAKLVKYFLAALTIPEEDLWVNLSPDETTRVIPEAFAKTFMGQQLLAQDYLLKQLTASLLHPDYPLGKKFWEKIYQETQERYGTTNISWDNFNRVWIVPEKAVVYEHDLMAFVAETSLKVLVEEDFFALNDSENKKGQRALSKENISKEAFREIILPAITKEVNEGQTFASLRQICHAMILAVWYKRNLRESILSQFYFDQKKILGIETEDITYKDKIYRQYVEAFQKGVFEFIREDYDPNSAIFMPRKYFSGGARLQYSQVATEVNSWEGYASSSNLLSLEPFAPIGRPLKMRVNLEASLSGNKDIDHAMLTDEQIFGQSKSTVKIFLSSLSEDDRAIAILELQDRIIKRAPFNIAQGQWGDFFFELPAFGFNSAQAEKIVEALNLDYHLARENFVSTWEQFFIVFRSMETDRWDAEDINYLRHLSILKNTIAFLSLRRDELRTGRTEDLIQRRRFTEMIIQSVIHRTRRSYLLYPFLRQIAKEMFFLPSSKIAEIDRLMRIAEREVNVSMHKGQDLLSLDDLRRILEQGHQRRRSGPGGTYDPEVTKALEQLKDIIQQWMSERERFAVHPQEEVFDERTREELTDIEQIYNSGRRLEALLALTQLRNELQEKIIVTIKKADEEDHRDVRRYGEHIKIARQLAEKAYHLMEEEIALEQRIVELSGSIFEDVRGRVNSELSAAGAGQKTLSVNTLQEIGRAAVIIAQNMTYHNEENENLKYFAVQLLNLIQRKESPEIDILRIYGLVHQIRSILNKIIEDYDSQFKWRVKHIQSVPEGLEIDQPTPESLGFTQDFLQTTIWNQFTERFMFDLEKTLEGIIQPLVSGLIINPYIEEDVRAAAAFVPGRLDIQGRVVNLKDRFADQPKLKWIGSKAYGLWEMDRMDLNVPEGFAVLANPQEEVIPIDLFKLVQREIHAIERKVNKNFGDGAMPLLLSMRSSFPISLPGEFDTVTNVGMNEESFAKLTARYGERFALEAYIRFLRGFAGLMIPGFEKPEISKKDSVINLREKLDVLKRALVSHKIAIPDDPWQQVEVIMNKIMYGSMQDRIKKILEIHGMSPDLPVNIVIQEMKFGNMTEDSYTAVVHTRNTKDGSNGLDVEMLFGSQGEDLVGDRRVSGDVFSHLPLEDEAGILSARKKIERVFGPSELEITREADTLFYLQVRTARLNPNAALRSLHSMVAEGILTESQARERGRSVQGSASYFVAQKDPIVKGAGVSGGPISGRIALSIEKAQEFTNQGENSVLILEFTPDRRVRDTYSSEIGVISHHGGVSQHYAVWARAIGRPYITMVDGIVIDKENGIVSISGQIFKEGEFLSMHGLKGTVYAGKLEIVEEVDKALLSEDQEDKYGGIALDPKYFNLQVKGIKSRIDFSEILHPELKISIDGLAPVIMQITPIQDMKMLFGLDESNEFKDLTLN